MHETSPLLTVLLNEAAAELLSQSSLRYSQLTPPQPLLPFCYVHPFPSNAGDVCRGGPGFCHVTGGYRNKDQRTAKKKRKKDFFQFSCKRREGWGADLHNTRDHIKISFQYVWAFRELFLLLNFCVSAAAIYHFSLSLFLSVCCICQGGAKRFPFAYKFSTSLSMHMRRRRRCRSSPQKKVKKKIKSNKSKN